MNHLMNFYVVNGYKYSSFIMEQIVPFNFFSEKELKILTELENYLHHLLVTHRGVDSWDNLKKMNI